MTKKQADNRYRAKITVNGKPIYVSAHTKRELEDKKREVRERCIGGAKPREMAFTALIVEWFDTFKRPHIKALSTLHSYQNAINLHILPCFPPQQLVKAVRRADLQRCLDRTAGMSSTVTNLVCSIFHHVFRYAAGEGMISIDPSVALVKPAPAPTKEKDAFTREQEIALLNTAASDPNGLMIYLLYYLGLRRGEMLGLQWGDIDWTHATVHIQRDIDFNTGSSSNAQVGSLKNRSANRFVPIPNELLKILRPLQGPPHHFILSAQNGKPLNANLYRTRFNRLMQQAGLASVSQRYKDRCSQLIREGKPVPPPNIAYDFDLHVTAHWFRHHYITAKVEAGERPEILMKIVGHRDYKTTINIYTHLRQTRSDIPITLLSEVFARELKSSND